MYRINKPQKHEVRGVRKEYILHDSVYINIRTDVTNINDWKMKKDKEKR